MSRIISTLLLSSLLLSSNAFAGDDECVEDIACQSQKSQKITAQSVKAQKITAYLESVGINNPTIINLTSNVGKHVENGHFKFVDESVAGGKMLLQYKLKSGVGIRNLELKFRPDGWQAEFIATTKEIKYNYTMEF